MTQGLRFGLCTDQNLSWEKTLERWRLFERLGFDSAWDCDHYVQPSRPTGPYLEAWTLLAALAAATERIRIGVLVSCNTFRHPALLAKEAVTVDHVSGGRLELGLGAGWYEPEHAMYGIEFPPPRELVDRFEEAVEVVDGLLRGDRTTYQGRHYQLRDAHFAPLPVQRPRPPLTLGAHGPRMLRIVARYADAWNSFGTTEQIRTRNAVLDEACATIGRDPKEIVRSLYYWVARADGDPWSSTDAFQDVVGRYREAGIDEFILDHPRDDQLDVLERVAADVIPRLRLAA
ncbi:MAG TPA: TIGR03560 family F420-dependent LLM class oxidoreductase [Candidatus Dormibacteraeota bacterium]|nr:TIGR03560 family F420-dependent LLM class oxidoreductase [Candidatus Dormibacteraeota bacterium]